MSTTPQTGEGRTIAVPVPLADARPEPDRAIPRGPGGHLTSKGPTCCRACREERTEGVGPARRWALTDKGYAALGQVNVRFPTKAQLEEIAEQNRRAPS